MAVDERPRFVSRGGIKLANALRRDAARPSPGAGAWTSAPRPAASPTACCSAAPRTSSRSTSPTASCDWSLRTDERVTVLERTQRALAGARRAALRARPRRGRRLLHLADQGAARGARVLRRALRRAGDGQAAVRGRPRARGQGRRRARGGGPRGRRSSRWRERPRAGAAVLGFASSGLPGPKGNRETFVWLAEAGRARRAGRPRGAGPRRSSRDVRARTATVSPTPPGADRRGAARAHRGRRARGRRAALRRRGDAQARPRRRARGSCSTRRSATTSSCASSLGGDGTILRALRRYAGTSVPVFAVNFGEVGFLATIDPEDDGDRRRSSGRSRGDFEVLTLPALALETPRGPQAAINDISFHRQRRRARRGARLRVDGEEVGLACAATGSCVATPGGSTGYNLANGGPVLAWGVEGYVVSFIAPHSLTARALVVAPERRARSSHNRGREEPVDVSRRRAPGRRARAGRRASSRRFLRGGGRRSRRLPGCVVLPPRCATKFGRLARARSLVHNYARTATCRSVGRRWYTSAVLLELRVENLLLIERAELRLGAGPQRAHGRDGRGQDRAGPRAGPAAGRPRARRDRAPGRGGGLRRGRVRAAGGAARRAGRAAARRRRGGRAGPARERRGAHARLPERALARRRRPARARPASCSRSTASTSTAG